MSRARSKRTGLWALWAMLLALLAAGPAQGAPEDPLFVFTPEPPRPPVKAPAIPPFAGYFEGPCGLAVDSAANIYVSDYYNEPIADHNAVDVFGPNPISYPYDYRTQIREVDPLDGPCGLAVDSTGGLYVNDYHRSVLKFTTSEFPPPPLPSQMPPFPIYYGAGQTIDSATPTGVAVDPATDDLYVDNRTYISAYDSSGAPLEVGGEPLRIGSGSLGDGYGLAISAFPATAGRLYVPDAADGVVKVYDPSLDTVNPVAVIDGHEVPGGGFVSLRDSAVAVDRVSGKVYVADNLQPHFTEFPQAAIYVFAPDGAYLGRLKHNVIDAKPPGLAVDNSTDATQGRVYVTSGNTELAGVYAYGPGAETDAALPPLPRQVPIGPSASPSLTGLTAGEGGHAAAGAAGAAPGAARTDALVEQRNLRVEVSGDLSPRALPRRGTAPIAIQVGGRILTTGDRELPQLRTMQIEFNRNGRIDGRGLPVCAAAQIRIASSTRALEACRGALVGSGTFEANVVLAGQEPYPTKGRLLLFNSRRHGAPALLGQIYAPRPFATSFVIPFELRRRPRGTFGTTITALLPKALGGWGYVTAIELKLSRRYAYRGKPRSFLSAGCPAPPGFSEVPFALARASFSFAGGERLSTTLTRSCRAR
jgi:DNA-binding beta-propeller fold protein YncE